MSIKVKTSFLSSLAVVFYITGNAQASTSEFPGRAEFPGIPIIEIQDLRAKLDDSFIVDARSSYEYDTLRIKDAVNLPVASETFEQDLAALVKTTNKPIVFYCNGRTCYKSYLAVKKGLKAGIKNLIAFDAGIFEWAKAYPDKAVLLGTSPVNPDKLLTKEHLHARFITPEAFSDKIAVNNTTKKIMVLDVRDKYQRAGIGFFPGMERWTSLDDQKKLRKYLALAKSNKQSLYIYDEVGQQVPWLQYALEEEGIKDYYFMEKGATGYYAMIKNMH